MLMKRITLGPELLSKLKTLQHGGFVCDEAGEVVGYFSPRRVVLSGTSECPLSTEELLEISERGGGRSLEEILASLEASA
jgi:hypothetical protein